MFLSSRKRSYVLYIQNLNAPARARVRDPSARFMSHKSRVSKVKMLQAQLKAVQTKTLNITMSLPSRTALATSQASALVGNILSFTRTKLYAPLKVEPLRCFGISWFVFMCFPVTWCISVYSFTVHQMCRVPSINLPVLELCPAKKRHLHGGQHLGGCDGDLSSLLWDSRESSVGEFLEPTRTMAKTSPDSRFGILQKPFPTSARNLGTSGPPPKNRNLPRFTLYRKRTSRNLPETQPSQSLRFAETPSTIPLWHPGVVGKH